MLRPFQITGVLGLSSLLSREVPGGRLRIPTGPIGLVGIGDEISLDYSKAFPEEAEPLPWRTNLQGLLDEFVRLADSTPPDFLRFAQKWGPLRVCQHFQPKEVCSESCKENYLDPIVVWRDYASRSKAMLQVAADLYQGRSGSNADWGTIFQFDVTESGDWFEAIALPIFTALVQSPLLEENILEVIVRVLNKGLKRRGWGSELGTREADREFTGRVPGGTAQGNLVPLQKRVLGWIMDVILTTTGARLTFTWDSQEPAIGLTPRDSLLAALACQLAFAIARGESLFLCSACSQPYTPTRRPAAGRRHYCPECGQRAASRDYARRKRNQMNNGR
jgi:hypothetical protein